MENTMQKPTFLRKRVVLLQEKTLYTHKKGGLSFE